MENAGIVRPTHSVAHNIIPEGAVSAEPARKILDKHKIDYNSTINEVLHNGRHPNEYIDAINKRISEADVINGKSGF
ncbi:AHH domain-containing protein [Pasteurella sp. PK-2025]|uniref:AHH domain-containing protein n=1 Tax=unclassified Pasteurella TaxID=2621516 RepID=UPI003C773CFA